MKQLIAAGTAMLALALGAFGQGSILVENFVLSNPYVCLNSPNNHYNGPFGLEIWELNSTTIPANYTGITGALGHNGYETEAYFMLGNSGFTLAKSYTGKTMSDGTFQFGQLNMPMVSPAGSSVVLALVAWASGASSPMTFPYAPYGMVVFVNPTADYTIAPPNTPTPKDLTGWDALGQSFVMGVPEPSVTTLAALGMAALVVSRRKSVRC